ncbi:MAG: hypothetical protein D3906_03135 [Candidatus Electrothrix sp. AUS1_2]|jgi:hypothetical protein|nr:hypothetical protein [Candidatus Electrothrix sp. AUS1_2]
MGNIKIHVPQHIQVEYTLDSAPLTQRVLELLNMLILRHNTTSSQSANKDHLLGLFAEEADALDQVVESAMQTRETATLRV